MGRKDEGKQLRKESRLKGKWKRKTKEGKSVEKEKRGKIRKESRLKERGKKQTEEGKSEKIWRDKQKGRSN